MREGERLTVRDEIESPADAMDDNEGGGGGGGGEGRRKKNRKCEVSENSMH